MKKFALIAIVFIVAACASKKAIVLTQADADRAATKFPGATLATLDQGKQTYLDACNNCHPYKKPASRTEDEWREIVPRMAKKAKLDAEHENLVLQYVVTMGPMATPK